MAENGSMKVKKISRGSLKLKYIVPVTHLVLFKHCSGGNFTVLNGEFEKFIKPLLIIHGIKEITVI